jgi:class 3 adenylate cyclase
VALVGMFLVGLGIGVHDKWERLGQPDVGFRLNGPFLYPTRDDAADLGLRFGGRALEVNGKPIGVNLRGGLPESVRTEPGEHNVVRFRRPFGGERTVEVPVRVWRVADAWFTQGAIDAFGVLFAALGIATFLVRPWQPASWALLAFSSLSGGLLTTLYVPDDPSHPLWGLYFRILGALVFVTPFHAALAFPVVHPWLIRGARRALLGLYGWGGLLAALGLSAAVVRDPSYLTLVSALGSGTFLLGSLALVARCCWLAMRAREPLVGQRARILLAGTLLGFVPVGLTVYLQFGIGVLSLDARLAYWTLIFFLIALVRVTLRQELMNARVAVRRAFVYTAAVAMLTIVTVWLSALSPWAVALVLFPLLYLWPRFDRRLEQRLYPKRARTPELVRELGQELGRQSSVAEVLAVLARAPGHLLDSDGALAFLLPGPVAARGERAAAGCLESVDDRPLDQERLIEMLRVTRKELSRAAVAVEPGFANVRDELLLGLERLRAEILLPILDDDGRVVGGLAVGARTSGDPYESFELDLLHTIAQQAWESAVRVHATDRLRQREREFADLGRFFPPQIIERALAEGSALELRRVRKPVTVVFADLRGFTSFSDSVDPEEVMETLTAFHDAMGEQIRRFAGTLERFTGDGFMVFFNDPLEQKDHVERAVRMALEMRETMRGLREAWDRRGYAIDMGLGIDTGYATCGFIGYEGRRDYGVIGRVTIRAARLSDVAAGGQVLISARVQAELGPGYETEPAGEIELKGFARAEPTHRLIGRASPVRIAARGER